MGGRQSPLRKQESLSIPDTWAPAALGSPVGCGRGVTPSPCSSWGCLVALALNQNLPGMLRKLEIQQEEDLQSVMEVAAHVFSDGVTNWGRVVTLISFGAFVAKHLKSIKQEQSISSLAGIITDALVSSKREWLESQGGWVSHCPPRIPGLFPTFQPFPVSVTRPRVSVLTHCFHPGVRGGCGAAGSTHHELPGVVSAKNDFLSSLGTAFPEPGSAELAWSWSMPAGVAEMGLGEWGSAV